jgi:hypothetical protein
MDCRPADLRLLAGGAMAARIWCRFKHVFALQ